VVGLARDEPDQFLQIVVGHGQHGDVGVIVIGADPKYQSFAVEVEQPQIAQCRGDLVVEGDRVGGLG
jgi:hypothetical protein